MGWLKWIFWPNPVFLVIEWNASDFCLFLMAVAKIVFLCSEVTAVSTYFIKPIYERLGFSDGSDGKKNPPAMRESWVWSLGWGRVPGGGHGNPLQYSCLEKAHGQRSLADCSPRGRKESDMTERQSTAHEWLLCKAYKHIMYRLVSKSSHCLYLR